VFATLLGGLPRPPLPSGASAQELVAAAVAAQAAAGLEPLTDGGLWGPDRLRDAAERWRATSALTDRAVKAAITGPWTATLAGLPAADAGSNTLEDVFAAAAGTANATIRALAAAGCPLVEVHEPLAAAIGADPAIRRRFVETQRRMLDGVAGIHASLAITGGSADAAGIETLLGAPFASLALDLVHGPDNWRLAAAAPRGIGVVCGAMTADPTGDESVEILLYALNYAASTGGRGSDRVGLATAGDLADVPWAVAERRMRRLGEAIRLAAATPDERAAAVDPRAVSIRGAALGRAGIRRARRDRPSST
jgi:methionine synthase II (cobalamin-independent)